MTFLLLTFLTTLTTSIWDPQGHGRFYLAESFKYPDLASSGWKYYKSFKKSDLFSIENYEENDLLKVRPFSQKQQIMRPLKSELLFKNHLYFQFEAEFPYTEDHNAPIAIKLVNSKNGNASPVLTVTVGIGPGKIRAPLTVGINVYKCYGASSECVEQMIGSNEVSVEMVRMYPKRVSLEIHTGHYVVWVDSTLIVNNTILQLTKTQSTLVGLLSITDVVVETPNLVESGDPIHLDNLFLTDNRRSLTNWTNQIQMFRHESLYDFLVRLNYTNRFRLAKYILILTLPVTLLLFLLIWRVLSMRNIDFEEDEDVEQSQVDKEVPETLRRR